MKILNELVELANKANSAGHGTPEIVEFRVVANPDNILAIDEEFRAQKQRAEAAEKERDRRIADYKRLIDQHMPRTIDGCDEGWSRVIEAHELQTKLEAAEAKLAELEKQASEQKPLMYGIMTANGDAHFEDFCVSSDPGLLEDVIWEWNNSLADNEPKSRVVALYTRPTPNE